jgi:hypothetical protein
MTHIGELSDTDLEMPQLRVPLRGMVVLELANELPNPAATLETIDKLLTTPDEEGRMIPELEMKGGFVDGEKGVKTYFYDENVEEVGHVGSARLDYFDNTMQAKLGSVKADSGRGYGRRIYLEAIRHTLKLGYDFRTDSVTQTQDAVDMWRWLEAKGIAQKVDEFVPSPWAKGAFQGYYVVNGNNRPKATERP